MALGSGIMTYHGGAMRVFFKYCFHTGYRMEDFRLLWNIAIRGSWCSKLLLEAMIWSESVFVMGVRW